MTGALSLGMPMTKRLPRPPSRRPVVPPPPVSKVTGHRLFPGDVEPRRESRVACPHEIVTTLCRRPARRPARRSVRRTLRRLLQ